MAILVQNDAGSIDGANAYVSVAEFKAYHDGRGNSYGAAADAAIEQAIVRATDYLDTRFRFVGIRCRPEQRTAWPRVAAEDPDRFVRTGIPVEVKEACSEYALLALTQEVNPNPTQDATGRPVQAKSSAVGPISESTTYAAGAVFQLPKYPKADQKIRPLTEVGWEVRRG